MGLSFVANAAITGTQVDRNDAFGCVAICDMLDEIRLALRGAFSREISGMTASAALVPRTAKCSALVVQFDENVVDRLWSGRIRP